MYKFETSEQVRRGHPDRIVDIVTEKVGGYLIAMDNQARFGLEGLYNGNLFVLGGEVNSDAAFDPSFGEEVVQIVHRITGDDNLQVVNAINPQSGQIVDNMKSGAGDQVVCYGYNDPYQNYGVHETMEIATKICIALDNASITSDYADGKVIVADEFGVLSIILSAQEPNSALLYPEWLSKVKTMVNYLVRKKYNRSYRLTINPGGRFIKGGASFDTGVSGRKTQCDTYGSNVLHGGGNINGKDGTKADRLGSYIARHLAVSLSEDFGTECTTRIVYEMGESKPSHATYCIDGSWDKIDFISDFSEYIDFFQMKNPEVYNSIKYSHFISPGRNFEWNL
jgi:S-adenosylmethionine synthetase